MTSQELIQKAVHIIGEKVKPTTFPLGIKTLHSDEDLPSKVKRPSKLGQRWALCQAFFSARSLGWTIMLSPKDQACPIAQILLGFEKPEPIFTEGNLSLGMYAETLEAGAKSEAILSSFTPGQYKYVLIAPLEQFTFTTPDIVYIYGMPGQIARLIQAAVYKNGGSLTSSFSSHGGCVSTIAVTMLKNECQVALNGNGERIFAHAQDTEMSFTIPWDKLNDVIEGLEGTHKHGLRYPYPSFINFTPQFPPEYNKLLEIWSSEPENK